MFIIAGRNMFISQRDRHEHVYIRRYIHMLINLSQDREIAKYVPLSYWGKHMFISYGMPPAGTGRCIS